MTAETQATYAGPDLIRTPVLGILLGYVVASFLASAGVSLVFIAMQPSAYSFHDLLKASLLDPLALWPLVLLLCSAPFLGLRWGLSQTKPYRPWKHMAAGALAGTLLSTLLTEGNLVQFLTPAFAAIGAVCGLASHAIEARARRWRLGWMQRKLADHPGWRGTISAELARADGVRPDDTSPGLTPPKSPRSEKKEPPTT